MIFLAKLFAAATLAINVHGIAFAQNADPSKTEVKKIDSLPVESQTLIYDAIDKLADKMALELQKTLKDKDNLIIFDGNTVPPLVSYEIYCKQVEQYKISYQYLLQDKIESIVKNLDCKKTNNKFPIPPPETARSIGALAEPITAALNTVAGILSFFRSNDVTQFGNIEAIQQRVLAAKLFSAFQKSKMTVQIITPSQYTQPTVASIENVMYQIAILNFLSRQADTINDASESDKKLINDLKRSISTLTKSLAPSSEQINKDNSSIKNTPNLSPPSKQNNQGIPPINKMPNLPHPSEQNSKDSSSTDKPPQEDKSTPTDNLFLKIALGTDFFNAVNDTGKGTYFLSVNSEAQGGSTKTSDSLFTTIFTGSRVTYSGGAVVSYILRDKEGLIKAADVFHYNTGFNEGGKRNNFTPEQR